MEDYIISGMAAGNEIRYVAAYTKGTVETARATHDLSPVCTAALGRLLTAGAMMGAMCKNETDVLTLRIKGDGPIDSITVTANAQAEVKGLVRNNHVDIPPRADGHLDVGSAVGHGILTVIRDEGIGEPYVGQTNLVTGEIAEDITYYYAESEQIPTTVGLGVLTGREVPVLQAGGFITVRTGSAQDGNTLLIPHDDAELSMDAAACVGCGACVATCKNGSAMLFVAARVSSLALLPQGKPEAARRARAMVAKMDELGFGNCTNTRACEMECPKHVTIDHIARLNREYLKARFSE